jgi:hypothetical protein
MLCYVRRQGTHDGPMLGYVRRQRTCSGWGDDTARGRKNASDATLIMETSHAARGYDILLGKWGDVARASLSS